MRTAEHGWFKKLILPPPLLSFLFVLWFTISILWIAKTHWSQFKSTLNLVAVKKVFVSLKQDDTLSYDLSAHAFDLPSSSIEMDCWHGLSVGSICMCQSGVTTILVFSPAENSSQSCRMVQMSFHHVILSGNHYYYLSKYCISVLS